MSGGGVLAEEVLEAGAKLTLPTAPSPVTTHCTRLAGVSGANGAVHKGVPLEIGLWGQPCCRGWERAVEGVLVAAVEVAVAATRQDLGVF